MYGNPLTFKLLESTRISKHFEFIYPLSHFCIMQYNFSNFIDTKNISACLVKTVFHNE